MSRRPRYIPPREQPTLVEVSCRTLFGAPLLTPTQDFNEIAVGLLARALENRPVQLCAAAILSIHYHFLFAVRDARQLAEVMGYFNGNLAREILRLHPEWGERVWAHRYHSILISDDPETQWQRLRYILTNGTKEGLAQSPLDWLGIHAARPLVSGRPLEGHWFNRTKEWAARRRRESPAKHDYATPYTLHFAPLPAFANLSPEHYRHRVANLVRQLEQEAELQRDGRPVLGLPKILAQNPYTPQPIERTPAPAFFAADAAEHERLREALRDFYACYHPLSARLLQGDLEAATQFPLGCFPPALPFVEGVDDGGSARSVPSSVASIRSTKPNALHQAGATTMEMAQTAPRMTIGPRAPA